MAHFMSQIGHDAPNSPKVCAGTDFKDIHICLRVGVTDCIEQETACWSTVVCLRIQTQSQKHRIPQGIAGRLRLSICRSRSQEQYTQANRTITTAPNIVTHRQIRILQGHPNKLVNNQRPKSTTYPNAI
eukprot:scaffold94059_cov32-Prasinocladus_malaysianus.AAC.2